MLKNFGEKIFKLKYAQSPQESWEEAVGRVVGHVVKAEKEEDKTEYFARFYQIIQEGVFLPGGRILANAGTGISNLMNCFVLPLDDSRGGIYGTLKNAAEVFAWGGGVGYNFSKLREKGAVIGSTGGTSSGPLSFMELFDQTGEVIKQASRRGAQMGMMEVTHPDIINFVQHKSALNTRNERLMREIKRKTKYQEGHSTIKELGYSEDKVSQAVDKVEQSLLDNQLSHFNISVILTDEFMEAVLNKDDWGLVSPSTGEVVHALAAESLFYMIARNAWESGDPGVFFIDRAEEDNMVPYVGAIEATNPCGEVPLLPYESCCLGSINLTKFYLPDTNTINWEFLEYVVRLATRFLDNIQTVSVAPVEEINSQSKSLRRLGLGVMGWADLLAMLGLAYDSDEAFSLAERFSWFISFFAWVESMELAEERGVFAKFDADKINWNSLNKVLTAEYSEIPFEEGDEIDFSEFKLRNISVTSIAPTGSIALLADVNSSIEPFYSLVYKRNITEGVGNEARDFIIVYNELFKQQVEQLGLTEDEKSQLEEAALSTGSIQHLDFLPKEFRARFKTAHEIDWRDHIKAQSAWQKFTTNAVSKTINMPHDATQEDVMEAFLQMWMSGLKGGTIYRDGSKSFQILESPKS